MSKFNVSVVIPTKNRIEQLDICLDSIYKSSFKSVEIIVVDDNSDVNAKQNLVEKHKDKAVIIENKESYGVGICRNIGAQRSSSKYILFIDDDNIISKDMIKILYETMEANENVCIAMPLMYFKKQKDQIYYSGVCTSLKTTFIKRLPLEKTLQYPNSDIGINAAPNVFMVRKKQGDEIGWFDTHLKGVYTDLDYFLRLKINNNNLYAVISPDAKCWHDVPPKIRGYRDDTYKNKDRMYLLGRNRGIIMKRYSCIFYLMIFSLFIYPLFSLFYFFKILKFGNSVSLGSFLKGTLEGYKYIIFG